MQELACSLWDTQKADIDFHALGLWLCTFFEKYPIVAKNSKTQDVEQWQQDLRIATYIVRDDGTRFQFAHRSFLGYFLACYLWLSLAYAEHWSGTAQPSTADALPKTPVSKERLDFLAQLYRQGQAHEQTLFADNLYQLLHTTTHKKTMFTMLIRACRQGHIH